MDPIESTNKRVQNLLEMYAKNQRTINIDFRKEIDWLSSNRLTHQIHSYPAKLIAHIPHFFMANTIFSRQNDYVLDPFCGSGTVLLEAIALKRNPIGADANPLARLITLVKTTPVPEKKLNNAFLALKKRIPSRKTNSLSLDVVNLNYWFSEHVIHELECILEGIHECKNKKYKNFFLVCFSQIIRKVCRADPRLFVPVRLHHAKYPDNHWLKNKVEQRLLNIENADVRELFYLSVNDNIKRMQKFNMIVLQNQCAHPPILYNDARKLYSETAQEGNSINFLPDSVVQLIITSPPYSGAQKYLRATSLNLNWLGLISAREMKDKNKNIIGRENFCKQDFSQPSKTGIDKADRLLETLYQINPLRAHICAQYLIEMDLALSESFRVLKKGGYFVLICGNNTVCGHLFPTVDFISYIIKRKGGILRLRLVDSIRSHGLMTKRNKTSSMITREWVLVFEKA